MRSKSLTLMSIILASTAATACTSLENDLQKGFRYGADSQQLIEKADKNREPRQTPNGVNAYLWRSAMDQVGFLPLEKADSEAGVIMTKWYSAPREFGIRSQVTIEILDPDLRRDTVRVTVAKQRQNADGSWSEAETLSGTSQSLEDSIYSKARDIAPY